MKRILHAIRDEKRLVHERLFLLLAVNALIALAIVWVIVLIMGSDTMLLAAIGAAFILFLALVVFGIKKHRVNLSAVIIAIVLIFVMLPLTFFTGGGIYGGSPVWFVFCTLFVSMIVYGNKKYFLLIMEAIVAGVCFLLAYRFPWLVVQYPLETAYIGTYVSMVFVGAMLSMMVGFEILMLRREKQRSDEKSREIEELNRAQNRFFSSMSHEIRTPINTIIGLNEMTLRENVSDEVAENARHIQSASGILLSLINDILDMSKMESGKMEIIYAPYDVGKMLTEIVDMISVSAEKKNLTFTVDVDPTIPAKLSSDEMRIKQILINLLNNAVKYTASGSVSLAVQCLRTGMESVQVTYSVKDTGIGIRKESIPHLFDAFKRLDLHENRHIEGSGLGLSIVRQLVELLGGEITVNSIYTQGSVFTVTLGQQTVGEQQLGEFSPERFHTAGNRARRSGSFEAPNARVLIVDDNSTNLLVTEKLLRRTRVMTDTADSGEMCLRLALQTHYDVILMDHMMPGMDGIECLHALRSQAGGLCRETPVIVLTANAGAEDEALYRSEGFDAYLQKPLDTDMLEDTLLHILPESLTSVRDASAPRYQKGSDVRARPKIPILVTTDSVADLPQALLQKLHIPVLSYKICTDKGVFDDALEADGDVLFRYMSENTIAIRSECPSVKEYEAFFAKQLSIAKTVLHISMAQHSSQGYANAMEAAKAFYHVTVMDSGQLSSGLGLLVLDAATLMKSTPLASPEELKTELEVRAEQIQTSFLLENTEYLHRSGHLSKMLNSFCRAFMVHPMIIMHDSKLALGDIFFGTQKQVRRQYIHRALRSPETLHPEVLFITYAGMRQEEAEAIREEVQSIMTFENIYLQKASPSICANCGPGTFGLLFKRIRSNRDTTDS